MGARLMEHSRGEQSEAVLPRTREADLGVSEVEGELLVYDRRRQRAHCLNRPAALLWRLCDGRTPLDQLTARLNDQSAAPVDEQVVRQSLRRLERIHLLDGPWRAGPGESVTRRQLLRRLG